MALLNHSCAPNCVYIGGVREGTLAVRTVRDVSEGEELCVSYVDTMLPRRERMKELRDTKHFDCTCVRCCASLLPDTADFLLSCIMHPDCSFGSVAGEACIECSRVVSPNEAANAERRVREFTSRLYDLGTPPKRASALKFLSLQGGVRGKCVLGRSHYLLLELRVAIMNALTKAEDFLGAERVCREIIEIQDLCLKLKHAPETLRYVKWRAELLEKILEGSASSSRLPPKRKAELRRALKESKERVTGTGTVLYGI